MQAVDRLIRTAATEDDGTDHIGFETPRSGVATPQPDLQDKRLPGIMTFYGQVRPDPSTSEVNASLCSKPENAPPSDERQASQRESVSPTQLQSQLPAESPLPDSDSPAEDHSMLKHERLSALPIAVQQELRADHPYPTPPTSQSPSRKSTTHEQEIISKGEVEAVVPARKISIQSTSALSQASDVTSQAEIVAIKSNSSSITPSDAPEHTESRSPAHVSRPSESSTTQSSNKWYSLDGLKELTRGVIFKSGPPTPTRALSAAHPSPLEGRETPSRASNDGAETTGTQTPRGAAGAQAPATKGKLTIKIPEARNLRKSRDPYVVVVFQRNELISGGPRPSEDDEDASSAPIAMGGIAITRQASDSGRPPMAIPMRSRQSSNTSISDYNTFRNRSARLSFTNPKWDAQAILYVRSNAGKEL